ncbi:MAG: hypothetical protein WCJ39_03485 [bacterium]
MIEEDLDLQVVDADEIEKLKAAEQKKERVMELIKEEGLDKDPEFMQEVLQAFDGILEIQKGEE